MSGPALSWVDWTLLAVLLVSVAVGFWRGLVFEVLSLIGWIVAYVVAQALVWTVAPLLPVGTPGSALNHGLGFAIVFLCALIVWALASRLLRLVIHATPLQMIDRVLGGGFGLLRGAVLLLALATVMVLTPAGRSSAWRDSHAAAWLGSTLHGLRPLLPDSFARHLPA